MASTPAAERRHTRGGAGPALAVALPAVVFAFPLLYLAWSSLRLGGDLAAAVVDPQVLRPLGNSLLLAATVSIACAVIGTASAVAVARTDVLGRRTLTVALAMPLAVPSFVGATAMLSATGPGGLLPFVPRPVGFTGAVAVLSLLSYPYVYLPVLARLRGGSRTAEEAARLLGAGPWRTLRSIVLPQLRGSVAAGSLLVFLYVLSDFGAVALLRYETITRAIFSTRLLDRATSVTLGLLLALLALAVAALARRPDRAPPAAARAAGPATLRLGAARVPVSLAVWGVVLIALVLPLVVFMVWAVRGSASLGTAFGGVGDGLGFLARPMVNSGAAALVAAAAGAVALLPLAIASVRRPGRINGAASALVTSVLALPGLVTALALVFFAIGAPGPLGLLYQSFPLLILGYVLHFGAQSLRASQAAVAAVPDRLHEAARLLGATGWRRFITVDLPIIAPGVAAGAGLVLLSTLKELPATALLAPIGFDTLATTIYFAAEDGFFAEVGVASLVLVTVSALLTWALILRPQLRGAEEHRG